MYDHPSGILTRHYIACTSGRISRDEVYATHVRGKDLILGEDAVDRGTET